MEHFCMPTSRKVFNVGRFLPKGEDFLQRSRLFSAKHDQNTTLLQSIWEYRSTPLFPWMQCRPILRTNVSQ